LSRQSGTSRSSRKRGFRLRNVAYVLFPFNSKNCPISDRAQVAIKIDVVKKKTISFEGEENGRRKEMKGAEGARKISVFFASRRLSVPVVATEAIAIP